MLGSDAVPVIERIYIRTAKLGYRSQIPLSLVVTQRRDEVDLSSYIPDLNPQLALLPADPNEREGVLDFKVPLPSLAACNFSPTERSRL